MIQLVSTVSLEAKMISVWAYKTKIVPKTFSKKNYSLMIISSQLFTVLIVEHFSQQVHLATAN